MVHGKIQEWVKESTQESAQQVTQFVTQHRTASITAASVAGAAVLGLAAYLIFRHKPTPEEIEAMRRTRLMQIGRLVDGQIVDSDPDTPETTVMYAYRVAGVEYVCGQDLSALEAAAIKFRADLPVQVRYDAHNPFNSIVCAEGWSGLRS